MDSISHRAESHEEHGAVIEMEALPDQEPLLKLSPSPGTSVIAKIHCGRASSGFVFFHEIYEWLCKFFFGGLTAYFNDERFFKMKTTIVYAFFAAILSVGLIRGQSYLAYVMSEMIPMKHEGWMVLTRRLTAFFLVLAVANEVVWRTMSTDAWVKIETFGFPILMFVFLWSQIVALEKFTETDEAE